MDEVTVEPELGIDGVAIAKARATSRTVDEQVNQRARIGREADHERQYLAGR